MSARDAAALIAAATVASALTAVAVASVSTDAIAIPAAAGAVLVAALAVGEAASRTAGPSPAAPRARPVPQSGIRDWLGAGEMGREDLLLLLDRLERKTSNPNLPARTPQEVTALARLTPPEFRRYLARRLDALEGSV